MAASAPPTPDTKKPAGPKPGQAPAVAKVPAPAAADAAQAPRKAPEGPEAAQQARKKVPGDQAPPDTQTSNTWGQQRADRMAVRAKLSVSEPGDAVEREADAVADEVARRLGEPRASGPGTGQASPPDGPVRVQRRAQGLHREARAGATPQPTGAGTAQPQDRLQARQGQGQSLPAGVRSAMEGQFGRDLSGVRVHTDAEAQQLARQYEAEAFTVGQDIYFAPGRFEPESPEGLHLLAHEMTHVAQQEGAGVQRQVMRRRGGGGGGGGRGSSGGGGSGAGATGTPGSAATTAAGGGATVDHTARTITIPTLQVPSYARKAGAVPQPLPLPKNPTRPHDQRQVWATGVQAKPGYAEAVKRRVDQRRGVRNARTNKMVHVLKPRGSDTYIVGDIDAIPAKVALPRWNRSGSHSQYDVDHIREMQLGGTNDIANMEMLDASANRSSGSLIRAEINSKLSTAIAPEVGRGKHWSRAPDLKRVQSDYQVTFTAISPTLTVAGNPNNFWSADAVGGGEHMDALQTLTASQINSRHLIGDDTHLVIYPRASGGGANNIPWRPDTNTPGAFNGRGLFQNFTATGISYTPGSGGSITGTKKFGDNLLEEKTVTWRLVEMDGMDYTVYVDKSSVTAALASASMPGASPVELTDVDLDDRGAITATGVLRPSVPLLQGLELDLTISNDQIWLSKTFNGGELQFPGPIQVMGSTLTLAAGTGGLRVEGDVDYEITRLGKGKVSGNGSFGGTSGLGFGVRGFFELDKQVFDGEARVDAGYENQAFWLRGHLAIGDGKIRGIQSASIDASYEQNTFKATGSVVPKIPAVDNAALSIEYSEAAGLKFAGDLTFKDNPLISGGNIHIDAAQPPDGAGFKVKGNGTATPKIPGVSSTLSASYDDGAFTADFSGAFRRGMLSGTVSVGVTNRAVDEQGNLGGLDDPDAPLKVYGSGSATLRVAPWLQATAGVRFSPTGDVTVSGEIGLPGDVELFPRQEIDKRLFGLSTQIPIVPGVVAEVGGSLSAKAGIGPGKLDQLRLGIEYNPADEAATHVTGDAHVNVPADAGLRLAARAGIGLGITGASATGGIELGGALGIDGAAEAGVHIDWMPGRGLVLDANAAFHAEPVFKFDVSGYVSVSALGMSVYDNTWQLAAYEVGSGLRFGVNFPVHYEEGQPFSVSMDDVEFEVPDVDPAAIVEQVGNEIF